MERDPEDHGPIQNFIAALYSAPFYAVAPRLGLRAGLVNLLLLVTLLGFITAMRVGAGATEVFGHWQAGVAEGRIPILTVANGLLTVEGPQPWVGYGPNGVVAIIDTTGRYSGLPDSVSAGIFLGRTGGIYRTAPKVASAIPYGREGTPTRLDEAGVRALGRVVLPALVVIGGVVFGFYFLVANGLLAFLLAAPAHWLSRRLAPEVRYHEILTLTLFVLTPVALVFLALGLVSPAAVLGLWPLYPALTTWILLGRIRRWLTPQGPRDGTP